MSEHTPGQWTIYEQNKNYYEVHGSGTVIAHVANGDAAVAGANVSLIAAAPELLEALKESLDVMGDWGDDGDPAWASRARSAIKKAENKIAS